MFIVFLVFGLLISVLTFWFGFVQHMQKQRRLLGLFLCLAGGITGVAACGIWPLLGINSLHKTYGAQFDWGPLGTPIGVALLMIMYGSFLCVALLIIASIWIAISKTAKIADPAASADLDALG